VNGRERWAVSTDNPGGVTCAPVHRADGITHAERYLARLCKRSFLSLWSYSGLYRDQMTGKGGHGKEVCDLLVVFQDHVLIFSDKDCQYPDTGNEALDWCRWFRRAVLASAQQVWGAERWLRQHPDRLFLDRACTQLFPIDLPDPARAKYHRIVVAHDASRRCRELLRGSGSLMIDPGVVGEQHYADPAKVKPFTVGQLDPKRGFVHVFDDTTLGAVLGTLDTAADFVAYLTKKERFIQSGRLAFAAGEDNLLAYYLKYLNEEKEHDFVVPADAKEVVIEQGRWEKFVVHPQRLAQVEENKVSYVWDRLIELFGHYILNGTLHDKFNWTVRQREQAVRILAAECRTERRLLGKFILDLVLSSVGNKRVLRRVMLPTSPGRPHYAFLLVPQSAFGPGQDYRELRCKLLQALCMVVRLKYPEAKDIVGIATESGDGDLRSEDLVYLDGRYWTAEMEAEATMLQRETGFLTNPSGPFHYTVKDYPDEPMPSMRLNVNTPARPRSMRNSPCPCRSGKKYKQCCMRRRPPTSY
jgi:hypothetical protein